LNKHYSWLINPTTKDFVLENGAPVRDESLHFPCYARLKIEKEAWMYAPSKDYGNSLSGLAKRQQTTPTLCQKLIEKALEPIIQDGRAEAIDVNVKAVSHFGIDLDINITDAANQNQTIELRQVNI
jgi:phage gp46-like protein